MQSPLRILMVAAEMVPFAKTGGPADVVGALPKALRALGHDVRVAIPRYGQTDPARFGLQLALPPYPVPVGDQSESATLLVATLGAPEAPLPVYLVDSPRYFGSDGAPGYEDDADRFIFFCRAALEGVRHLGWCPDVVHCHDWHTAIVPNWLKTLYRRDPFFAATASLFTIHNLSSQGSFGHRVLEVAGEETLDFVAHPDIPHLNDVVDFLGRGISYADIITTVSETYAQEILTPEFGEGLDPLLRERRARLFGVLNGIDVELYDPATDPYLAARYDARQPGGRVRCKAELQRGAGLPIRPDVPLIGTVSRLTDQKGFDLIDAIAEPLLAGHDLQLVILGTGEHRYHERLAALRARFPRQVALFLTFNARTALRIYGGADMYLMPSRMEPCGLGQLLALRYGAIPIVRATGGLADTVRDFDPATGAGNGFAFQRYEPLALYAAIVRALETYRYRETWQRLIRRAMAADHSWRVSAQRYVVLYQRAMRLRAAEAGGPQP